MIQEKFEKTIAVRWSDCDINQHVRHSAYYDYGAHVRIRFFQEYGFAVKAMSQLGIGPILFKEECSFIKEIRPYDTITVNMLRGEISDDASRWVLHHEIFNQKGEKNAHITVKGAWIDLQLRKLTIPPTEFVEAINKLPEGADYFYQKKQDN